MPEVAGSLRYRSTTGRRVIAASVMGSSIAALDATVVGIALPTIGRDFDVGVTALQWVVDAYTLTLAGLLLLGGSLGDRYGRRLCSPSASSGSPSLRRLRAGARTSACSIAACGPAGRRRGAAVPGSLAILQASFAEEDRGRGNRRVVRARRRGHRCRPAPRRVAHHRGFVAAGLLHQPPGGRPRPWP